jgi:hypothetical protein
MGRPRIGRDRDDAGRAAARYRAKLAEIVHPERVLADLSSTYDRAYLADQDAVRAGMKKLMRRWDKATASPAGVASNQSSLRWGPFGSWATIAGLQIWDQSTGGLMLWEAPLVAARTLVPNDPLDVAPGGLNCGLS